MRIPSIFFDREIPKMKRLHFLRSFVAMAVVVSLPISAFADPVREEEYEYQNKQFKHWWETDLVWKFDDLPSKGSVSKDRLPYSGYIYPDNVGGTERVLWKYDRAFHNGQGLAANYERYDIRIHSTGSTTTRRGLFGRVYTVRTGGVPHWSGHCNGWVSAAIRHAEPEQNVVRNGVVFTPADIKGLLAELYMYTDTEFLGGVDYAINPALLHVSVCNWVGRGKMPIGMEKAVGKEVWNYPIYAYASSSAKRGDDQVEVKINIGYVNSVNREYDRSPDNFTYIYFHYLLDLNDKGEITGGEYYRDSNQIDMLWAPMKPVPGGEKGNEKGNPHLDVKEVLAIWRESVPEEKRKFWWNIDPIEEDRVILPEQETNTQLAEAKPDATDNADAAEESAAADSTADAATGAVGAAVEETTTSIVATDLETTADDGDQAGADATETGETETGETETDATEAGDSSSE